MKNRSKRPLDMLNINWRLYAKMVTQHAVADAWKNGRSLKGSDMYTDGTTVYSYGEHFPIATKINGIILFNKDKYSYSTSKHQSYVHSTINDCYFCTTSEIRKAIQERPPVIVLTKKLELTSITECLESMRKIYKTNNKHFPMAKLKQIIIADFI
jgi:hypothetical protein